MWDVITHPMPNFNGGLTKAVVSTGMKKYIQLFDTDDSEAGLADFCYQNGQLVEFKFYVWRYPNSSFL